MNKINNILVLAGGDSTRFWPLTQKNLTNFLGKPLIQYVVDNLIPFANHIIVVTNSEDKKELEKLLKVDLLVQDEKQTSQAGAILSAENSIKGETLIVNANDILNPNIVSSLISRVSEKKLECVITAKKIRSYFPGGYLIFKEKKLSGIVERPGADKMPSPYVRLVVDYFSDFSKLVSIIKSLKNPGDDGYEQALNIAISSLKSDYLVYDDFWFTIKYPWHILTMMQHYLQTLGKHQVKLGKNVRIGKFVKISGPAFIGDNTIIGDYALVRQSHIGQNCLIGSYSEVARSYLGNNIMLHRNYVGDSILENNSSMGAGAVTANFRFDAESVISVVGGEKIDTRLIKLGAILGDGVKIGVNSTLLPGIKIGRNTFIGPGEVIDKDVENNKFIFRGIKKNNKTT